MNKLAIALTALSFAAISQGQTLIGDTITTYREIPSIAYLYGPFNAVVAPGLGDEVMLSPTNNIAVNVESSSIDVNFYAPGGAGGAPTITDHVVVITGIDWVAQPTLYIGSVTATGNVINFSPTDVSFSANEVRLNISNYNNWVGGEQVHIELKAVPEPATLAVFGVGLIAVLRRRRS